MSDVRIRSMDDEGGLLPIGIVAIVIGTVAALVLLIVFLYFCCFRRRGTSSRSSEPGCWCWGQRRVVVVHKHSDKPRLSEVPRQRVVVRQQDPYPDMSYIHTMPVYLRGQHLRPWMDSDRRQGFVRLNGSLDHTATMPRALMGPTQRRAIMAASTSDNVLAPASTCTTPSVYMQRGGSLRLTTTQGEVPPHMLNANTTSVITQADPEPTHVIAVRSSAPETPPRVTMTAASSNLYPILSPVSPHFRPSSQPVTMATAAMGTVAAYDLAGSNLEYDGPSATINILPPEGGTAQTYSVDPYSLVENPTGESGTVYVRGGMNSHDY